MFKISLNIIEIILKDYGIFSKPISFIELQRYNYDKDNHDKNNLNLKQVDMHVLPEKLVSVWNRIKVVRGGSVAV